MTAFPLAPRFLEIGGVPEALDALLAAFVRTRGTERAVVSIVGAPGAGKSRLLRAMRREIRERFRDARVFLAAATAGEEPYGPVARIIAARLGITPGLPVDEAHARIAAVVGELLPAPRQQETTHLVAHLIGVPVAGSSIVEPIADAPPKLEARAFVALKRLCAADAARTPLVFAVDDLDLAGPDTLRLLSYLAAGLGHAPLLIVTAAESAVIEGEAEVERLTLPPLDGDDAEALLGELLAPIGEVPPRAVAEAARRVGQTPRAVLELVRYLLDRGVIAPRGAAFVLDADRLAATALPGDVGTLAAARVAGLPAGERELLEKAAACGERFWLDALVALERADSLAAAPDGPSLAEIAAAGDRTRVGVAALLGELAHKGWIVEQESRVPGGREYRFAHAPLRAVVAARMDPAARRAHHLRLAEWLELRPEGRDGDAQEEIGRHLEEAGDGDGAAACFRRAADEARARFLHPRAIRLYARALACASRESLATRIHVWHDLGSVYELKGEYDAALAAFEHMLRLTWVASSRSKAAVAFNKLGRVWRRKGNLKLALDYLERGHALFEQAADGRGIAGSLDDIGHVLYLMGRYDDAHARIAAALARRGKGGDKRSIAHSLSNLGNVHKDRGMLDEAESCHRQALELRLEIGDRAGAILSHANLAALLFARGDGEAARHAFEAALAESERIGAVPLTALVLTHLGEIALAEGKADEARRHLGEALALAVDLDDRRLLSDASRLSALAELDGGDAARAAALAADALRLADEAGLKQHVGRALLALGQVHAATLYDAGAGDEPRGAAARFFERGVLVFRELGNAAELARGLERFGRFRLEGGDVVAGRGMLEEARGLYARLGMRARDEVDRMINEL